MFDAANTGFDGLPYGVRLVGVSGGVGVAVISFDGDGPNLFGGVLNGVERVGGGGHLELMTLMKSLPSFSSARQPGGQHWAGITWLSSLERIWQAQVAAPSGVVEVTVTARL